jgi:putative heme iron utilization protein
MPESPALNAGHEPRLVRLLRALLHGQRVAVLACVDDDGRACVSMVPFAFEPDLGCLVIHVSALAAHTQFMLARPDVGLMVCAPEVIGQPVHALQRVSLQGRSERLPAQTPAWQACRQAYLARFEEARPMTELGDFSFFSITPVSARHIAGFGAARTVGAEELRHVFTP